MTGTDAGIGHGMTLRIADPATPGEWIYIEEVGDVNFGDVSTDPVEATHQGSSDRYREFIPGPNDLGSFTFPINLVPNSAADRALRAAKGKERICEVTFASGNQMIFRGLREAYQKTAPVDGKISADVSFRVTREPLLTAPVAPINIAAPTVFGVAQVGAPLTLSPGVWAGANGFAYQWKAAGVAISGAVGTSYVPVDADVGKAITCTVTASNAVFSTVITSAATDATLSAGGAEQYASSAAPAGYRWDFVTQDGQRITQDNVPVVDLVRAA